MVKNILTNCWIATVAYLKKQVLPVFEGGVFSASVSLQVILLKMHAKDTANEA